MSRKRNTIEARKAVEDWFAAKGWTPFPFQKRCWKAYLAGDDGLLHAATGAGKTLAVGLGPAIEALAEGARDSQAKVLWVTPLRALAADTAQALESPIRDLGLPWSVETRTGDTPAHVRNRQAKRLPTILVTTPESVSLLLTREDAREQLRNLRALVVDEWHELLGTKRGVLVELAAARLRTWLPSLRTWGLSATLGNLEQALEVLTGGAPDREGRLVRGGGNKEYAIRSCLPETVERFPWGGHLGLKLLPQVIDGIEAARTSLVFTNTRSQTEAWYQALLDARPDWAGEIALHHGSLDPKVRLWVEDGLRSGSLRAVVCTSSLDLGVDFSQVDRVFQIGSPKGVARLLQRAGRSGHGPGRVSLVTCAPTNAFELVEAAAARNAMQAGHIEAREPLAKPLDVLVQHIVTVATGEGLRPDELLAEVRKTHAYRTLTNEEWEWALDFAASGGVLRAYPEYAKLRLEEGVYRPASPKIAQRHRMSIGVIVSDAAMGVQYLNGARIGSVEDSFLSRLQPGDVFVFGGKALELVRIRDMTAWVRKASSPSGPIPRWMGGRMPLSSELADAVRAKLDEARRGVFRGPEMEVVRPILELQAERSRLPRPDELLIETVRSREGWHVFLYPFAGRLAHEGLAAVLAYRMSTLQPITFSLSVNDYGIELLSAQPAPLEQALREGWLSPENLEDDALRSMNATEMAKRQFREIARVAGLVFQGYPGSGKTAKQTQASSSLLYDVFAKYDPDNLLLRQAREELLERQLDAKRLRAALERIAGGKTIVVAVERPTPLGFPLLVERLRERLSSEKLADRVRRMQASLEAAS